MKNLELAHDRLCRVGDDGPVEELTWAVHQLLIERPLRLEQIVEATGAADRRIKGVILGLQRQGVGVVDVVAGDGRHALWFIPSAAVLERLTRAAARAKSATKRSP